MRACGACRLIWMHCARAGAADWRAGGMLCHCSVQVFLEHHQQDGHRSRHRLRERAGMHTVAFGPSGSTKAVPKWHVQNEVLGMIYVREPTYQTCSGACADDIHQLGIELDFSKQNGYQDVTEERIETINGTRVKNVYINTGAIYGKSLITADETVKGAIISAAWYLNTGNTTFQPQYNDFYVSEMDVTDGTIAGPVSIP